MNPDVYLVARDIIQENGWMPGNPFNSDEEDDRQCMLTALALAIERCDGTQFDATLIYQPILKNVCVHKYGTMDFITVNDKHIKRQEEVVDIFESAYKLATK